MFPSENIILRKTLYGIMFILQRLQTKAASFYLNKKEAKTKASFLFKVKKIVLYDYYYSSVSRNAIYNGNVRICSVRPTL